MKIIKNQYGTFIEPDFRIIDKTDFKAHTSEVNKTGYSLSFTLSYCCVLGILSGFLYSFILGW